MEGKKLVRGFTLEQKFAMLKDIETCQTVKEGVEQYHLCPLVSQKLKR